MQPSPIQDLVSALHEGFSFQAFAHFQRNIQLSAGDVAELLGIPRSTLARRKLAGRLAKDESERLLRYSSLFAAAVELFEGNADAARRWLQTPKRALNHVTPLRMAATEVGAREVEKLLDRLENGVYS